MIKQLGFQIDTNKINDFLVTVSAPMSNFRTVQVLHNEN